MRGTGIYGIPRANQRAHVMQAISALRRGEPDNNAPCVISTPCGEHFMFGAIRPREAAHCEITTSVTPCHASFEQSVATMLER
jgi:hypothetical protein